MLQRAGKPRPPANCSMFYLRRKGLKHLARVALVQCAGYETQQVRASFTRAMELMGGFDRFARDGEILLKPNLLAGEPPDKLVTTHPSVMAAVAEVALGTGARVVMGDSPGFGAPRRAAEKAGLGPVYALGVGEADFESIREVAHPKGRIARSFPLSPDVAGAGLVVNCPKLKTHVLQTYTGAVKNLFGCVVGLNKARTHFQFPDRNVFADFLLDLYLSVKPGLTVMDAIVGMEGDGPRSGSPRHIGALIVADDALAADLVALELVGIPAEKVPVIAAARRRGLIPSRLEDVELLGDSLESLRVSDFKTPETASSTFGPRILQQALQNTLTARPEITVERCVGCGDCGRICPPGAIRIEAGKAFIDPKQCIRCYCCHEACARAAVTLKMGAIGHRLQRWLRRL